jgi:hypothetical protein
MRWVVVLAVTRQINAPEDGILMSYQMDNAKKTPGARLGVTGSDL